MAHEVYQAILKQGVAIWNKWRQENRGIRPDLEGIDLKAADLREIDFRAAHLPLADLSGADLLQADFRGADLRQADLITARLLMADLSGANLVLADLAKADLSGAHLLLADLAGASLLLPGLARAAPTGPDLQGGDLRGADLTGASLLGANLQEANLSGANLRGAHLARADLTGAIIGWNVFGANDLSLTRGLETVEHIGPSTIGIDTIYASKGIIPEAFLKGAGIPRRFIEYIASLTEQPIPFYPCFLAHVQQDSEFASRLYADLVTHNMSCWHFRYDLHGGRLWREQVSDALRSHDRLVLICSRNTIYSSNIVREILEAIDL